ncbi:ionotropic receptor 64a [Cochliomyia hominivorax]
MMLQIKYKYFNKKIKMMLLLLILMWSLMGQEHVYGKSSTYEIGIIKEAAATSLNSATNITSTMEAIDAIDDDVDDEDGDDTNGIRDMIQRNIATATTDTTTNDAKTIKTTTTTEAIAAAMKRKITIATENKDKNNNTNTIYGHINENDNNSNKLPQNVVKKEQQPEKQQEHQQQQYETNMMYMNMKMPAPLLPPSSSTSSLSITTLSEASVASETPSSSSSSSSSEPPPTESLLMPKDQLNKTEYKVPKSNEQNGNKNNKINDNNENKPEENRVELKMSTLKVNDTNSNNNNNDIVTAENTNNIKVLKDNETIISNLNTTTATTTISNDKIATINVTNGIDDDTNDDDDVSDGHNIDPEINNKNCEKLKTFDSLAHGQQELIAQFALKLKLIPRVTFFTCKEFETEELSGSRRENDDKITKRHTNFNLDLVEFVKRMYIAEESSSESPKLMMKVVLIDHLLSKNRVSSTSQTNRGGFGRTGAYGGGPGVNSGPATRNTFTNANWLEQILKPETLRQIVVLNLNCGESSRRLLEMASNKAFFNSMYHWLLLEDYVFNRQTEIDDADDIESKMNSDDMKAADTTTTTTKSNSKKEIVNDSNATIVVQVKKLSTYPSDVNGASTSGPDEQNKVTPTTLASSLSFSPTSYSTAQLKSDDNRMQQKQQQQQQRTLDENLTISSNSSSRIAGVTDEDDTEIIEKFLEKLNININTELILVKRRMRIIMPPPTTTIDTLTVEPPSLTTFTPSDSASTESPSNDYNTLQKMDYYLLYDVWNPGLQYGGELNISEIGSFSLSEGFKLANWYKSSSTTLRRINMNFAKVRCLVVITHKNRSDTLEEYLTSHYDTHLDSMNRFNFALLSHVRELFNFSFILSKTATWGYLKNGKFDGMIGALVRKQADIGGSPIFFRIERAKVIDYTTRTWVARPCFIFRHPRSTKKDRIVFLQPFSNDVWIFLAVCGFITIVLLWILTTLESKFDPEEFGLVKEPEEVKVFKRVFSAAIEQRMLENEKPVVKGGGFKRWFVRWGGLFCGQNSGDEKSRQRVGLFFESLLFYIGSICQQGLSFTTFLFSGRCIVITSLLFSFSIYQFYSASIVGTLLMEKPKTIRTLKDLIHSNLEIGVEDIVYNRDYFLRTKDPDAQELYAKKVTSIPMTDDTGFADVPPDSFALPPQATEMTDAQKAKAYRDILHSHETGAHAKTNEASNWYDPDFGVAKIKKGRFAFHVDVATAYKIIADTFTEKEICDLTEIQLFPPQKMVSIVQKGSPLRKVITYGLRRVTEVGLTDYQRKVWHSPKPRCVKQLHTDDLRVDMQTFTSALLVLIFGYAVSLLILSLEIVHFKLWQRYTTTTTEIETTT